eukprot:Anaeramoba_ignava/a611396_6.p1 GENE.a611396_6~~a611396_6.p1  ORF type:complete len:185 (-),score=12.36 a611396_6:404-958(-)
MIYYLKNLKRRAFTLAELLISFGIIAIISGGVILAMTRGSSNVHRGSFIAQASNQAGWIVAVMRKDIARSTVGKLQLDLDKKNKWAGKTPIKIILRSGTVIKYSIVKRGSGKALLREEVGKGKQYLAPEYLADFNLALGNKAVNLEMVLKDPSKKAKDYHWDAAIYFPEPSPTEKFWKPISSIK